VEPGTVGKVYPRAAGTPASGLPEAGPVTGQQEADMGDFFGIMAAGPFFFVSAWVLMLFAGAISTDVGIRPFGYVTSMVVTIALWLTVAPAIGAIARTGRKSS
jgi:hypothetical protein